MKYAHDVDVAIIGAGSGGLSAWHEIKKVTDNVVAINEGAYGTTCARVGCMPSKVLIQVANDFHRRHKLAVEGITDGTALRVNRREAMAFVRGLRDRFVRSAMTAVEQIGDRNISGRAVLTGPNTLEVNGRTIRARRIVLATGSTPIIPEAWRTFEDRVLTSDTIFEQEDFPERLAVMGAGIIAIELGQALSRLGIRVTALGRSGRIGGLSDPDINAYAVETMRREFELNFTHTSKVTANDDGTLHVAWGDESVTVDRVLAAMGRRPNVHGIGLEQLDVPFDSDGIPAYNRQTMQIGNLPIFISGDVTNELPVLHEASDEGRIAGYNSVHEPPIAFQRRTPLGVTFCEPNLAVCGRSHKELEGVDFHTGEVSFEGQGRSIVMSKDHGLLHVYGEAITGRLLGAELIAPAGEHLAHLLAWAIHQKMTVFDALSMPFYHPVVEEGLRTALRDLAGRVDPNRAGLEIPQASS
jgi:dihydrolipoamide dehydrogenase